ncbi:MULTISPECIES: FprA family A-type flavoprotein [Dictyoglomus]|jgi:flavorubredoxin|uniref:Beta-lactamase domain protein n=1 Tax=Dictyoglomus turgidum (strain DSM 6724 / Z-1310) TaxID=515635 RepID=B8E0M2_DICTD|nr:MULTISPECIES: FprA family A-type flavoprotein [Dictyoglomus]ACK43042.1 beta-lactamase domain protein [Dictyoglomus turgidum DSM 6724]HBU31103.1 FprA family A-type flavoprotein [Dictyoglomus sp.]
MKPRKIKEKVYYVGVPDWNRTLFDSLIPLPDGTSYNAYLVIGSEKTALIDTVDPTKKDILFSYFSNISKIDYVISHHAEQDHSGSIPFVLEKYPSAKVVTNPKGKELLKSHLHIPDDRFITVNDGEELSLGDKTLKFIYTPWVHWPETMVSYLMEDRILFTCDLFGSHYATSSLYVEDEKIVYEAAKRYYAEIMMPFRSIIQKNLEKIKELHIDLIAPSHGPIYNNPNFIINAYKDWISEDPKNIVVLPYVSMHDSTKIMVDYLADKLIEKGIAVEIFDLSTADIGKIAMALVDAATIIVGTPTVLAGPHPKALYVTYLANVLKPKAKFVSIIGSYGWGGRTLEILKNNLTNLNVEILNPVLVKGLPEKEDFKLLDELADAIYLKHKELGLTS